jgi:hypothetical protein
MGLEMNSEKTKCMVASREQHAGQNPNIKLAIRSVKLYRSSDMCKRQQLIQIAFVKNV